MSAREFSLVGSYQGVERFCCVWTIRLSSCLLLLASHVGLEHWRKLDSDSCSRAPNIAFFWSTCFNFSGILLVIDFALCSFFACRPSYLARFTGKIGRLVALVWAGIALNGLLQFGRQIKDGGDCVGPGSIVTFLLCFLNPLAWCMWSTFLDCDILDLGLNENTEEEDNCKCRISWRSLWLDIETVDLDAWPTPQVSASPRSVTESPGDEEQGTFFEDYAGSKNSKKGFKSNAILKSGVDHPKSSGSCRSLGSRRGRSKVRTEIRVLRRDEVLFVGKTKQAVRRWVRRNLKDREHRGISVLESSELRSRSDQ
eukprot:TRINITY_DN80883_c0_g1_i1.p1 TRINITY_DN80883_c0_g1~~TRINITY_DN80883_c0_g1_i1.p1  ORF type:complete len:329 (+),score=34.87 TRINITY_DN80883_c0_g1_i1:54-989(+)